MGWATLAGLLAGLDAGGWFAAALQGGQGAFPDGPPLAKAEVAAVRVELWQACKDAAAKLGWDRELVPATAAPKLGAGKAKLELKAGVLAAGGERMPYLLLTKGEPPKAGWPLFIQMHGGGSTDQKLPGPHGWAVNTNDWRAQVGVCLQAFPEGMYLIPRMANDNRGRWWYKHNHEAFEKALRRLTLFRGIDPDRVYLSGISEGAYGTEALAPFWADRIAGGCALAGGAGGGERFRCLRNTPLRSDTGERDAAFGRATLAREAHAFLDTLQRDDPQGYEHSLNIQPGRGHAIDYRPGPAWIAAKTRDPRPAKVVWFNFALDGVRRTDFAWLSLAQPPERDALLAAAIDRAANAVAVTATINPPGAKDEKPVYNTNTPAPVANRIPYVGNTLTLHLDDGMVDLDREVAVTVNGKPAFRGKLERRRGNLADDLRRTGDPRRTFPARLALPLR